jgi:hypothetical protein
VTVIVFETVLLPALADVTRKRSLILPVFRGFARMLSVLEDEAGIPVARDPARMPRPSSLTLTPAAATSPVLAI